MVAEAVVETTEVEVQATPEQEAPPEEPTLDEEDLSSLRAEGFISSEESEGTPTPTEEPAVSIAKLTPEQAVEEGRRQEREATSQRATTQYRQQEEQGIRNSLAQRRGAVEDHLASLGVDQATIRWVGQQFDQHHGQALQTNRYDMENLQSRLVRDFTGGLYESAGKAVKGLAQNHASYDDFFKEVVAKAREGYVTPANAKKQSDEAVIKYAAKLKAQGVLPSGKGSAAPSGTGGGSTGLPSRAQYADADTAQRRTWSQQFGSDYVDRITR